MDRFTELLNRQRNGEKLSRAETREYRILLSQCQDALVAASVR
jgi:hypothetical protein